MPLLVRMALPAVLPLMNSNSDKIGDIRKVGAFEELFTMPAPPMTSYGPPRC